MGQARFPEAVEAGPVQVVEVQAPDEALKVFGPHRQPGLRAIDLRAGAPIEAIEDLVRRGIGEHAYGFQALDQGHRALRRQPGPVAEVEVAIAGAGLALPVAEQRFDQGHCLRDDGVYAKVSPTFAQRFVLVVQRDHLDIGRRLLDAAGAQPLGQLFAGEGVGAWEVDERFARQVQVFVGNVGHGPILCR
ncbi:hypothetical protein PS623_02318 [Pseudomonas fluorescens]|nr:hypothetical protein PS623_02318 [Pseudomonas fluorescens]